MKSDRLDEIQRVADRISDRANGNGKHGKEGGRWIFLRKRDLSDLVRLLNSYAPKNEEVNRLIELLQ